MFGEATRWLVAYEPSDGDGQARFGRWRQRGMAATLVGAPAFDKELKVGLQPFLRRLLVKIYPGPVGSIARGRGQDYTRRLEQIRRGIQASAPALGAACAADFWLHQRF